MVHGGLVVKSSLQNTWVLGWSRRFKTHGSWVEVVASKPIGLGLKSSLQNPLVFGWSRRFKTHIGLELKSSLQKPIGLELKSSLQNPIGLGLKSSLQNPLVLSWSRRFKFQNPWWVVGSGFSAPEMVMLRYINYYQLLSRGQLVHLGVCCYSQFYCQNLNNKFSSIIIIIRILKLLNYFGASLHRR